MLKTKAYKFILKVRKSELPTVYSFNTAEGETWLWVDSAPPGLIGLKEVRDPIFLYDPSLRGPCKKGRLCMSKH